MTKRLIRFDWAVEDGRAIGREIGRKIGIEIGKEEGRFERELEIARTLKSKGVPLALIKESTGLTEQEINEL